MARNLDFAAVLVLEADARAIDVRALETWLLKGLNSSGLPPAMLEGAKSGIREKARAYGDWLDTFRSLGGRTIHQITAEPNIFDGGTAWIFPVEPRHDPERLRRWIQEQTDAAGRRTFDESPNRARVDGNLVLFISDTQARRSKPREWPAMEEALAASGPAAIRAGVDTTGLRNSLMAMSLWPRGSRMRDLLERSEWASIAIDLPPKPHLRMEIRANNETAASEIRTLVEQTLRPLGESPRWAGARDVLDLLVPLKKGDRLIWDYDEPALAKLWPVVGPAWQAFVEKAERHDRGK